MSTNNQNTQICFFEDKQSWGHCCAEVDRDETKNQNYGLRKLTISAALREAYHRSQRENDGRIVTDAWPEYLQDEYDNYQANMRRQQAFLENKQVLCNKKISCKRLEPVTRAR